MVFGIASGIYLLGFSITTSILLASMFASHTPIAYPIISKMGLAKNKAVGLTLGGTVITDILALLVLAIIIRMNVDSIENIADIPVEFWYKLSASVLIFGLAVLILFPLIARWVFKRVNDSVSRYIFVLVMLFLSAVMANIAGIEAIIGAFLAGLALNRLIPNTSPLMNRIEFIGNAIFIPFFLISVGMLIDYRVFVKDITTIYVAFVMTVIAIISKFAAAWLTQKTFGFSKDERRLIFGLSSTQAAATLAAVMIGFEFKIFDESVLNGSIIMILITCSIGSFSAQKGSKNLYVLETPEPDKSEIQENILLPVNNIEISDDIVTLGVAIKSPKRKTGLFALNIISEKSANEFSEKKANKILNKAAETATATDTLLHQLIRYDSNIVNGISGVIREHKITDMIIGISPKKGISENFIINLNEGILNRTNVTTLLYKPSQPFDTIKRHIVIIPEKAEKEIGFPLWLLKMWNIAKNSGGKLKFYGYDDTLKYIRELNKKHPVDCSFSEFTNWDDFLIIAREIRKEDNLIIVMSRKDKQSYHNNMKKIPSYLNKYFSETNFILIYPVQEGVMPDTDINLKYASIIETLGKLDEIGKTIYKLFKKN